MARQRFGCALRALLVAAGLLGVIVVLAPPLRRPVKDGLGSVVHIAAPTQGAASSDPTSPTSQYRSAGVSAADPVPCPLWPADNIWNRRIDDLPVHPLSDAFVDALGRNISLSNGFASRVWQGVSIGNPYDVVPSAQPMVPITFTDYAGVSDPGPYPYPT